MLYVQGMLEARLGNFPAATVAFKKLERQWPKSPFMGEAQIILAEDAVAHRRYKEAEGRLHQALAADIPSELKRKPQELLIWTLVEQERPQEALPIVQSLRPLEGRERPSEKGLAAIVEVLCAAGERGQAQSSLKEFENTYPRSELIPRVELAWGRLLGRSGEPKESAQVFRKLIKDHPGSAQADDARLALASLLTWEDALNLVDRMDRVTRESQPEVKKLWAEALNAWVGQRLEKGFPGELLARLKAGTFAALDAKARLGVVELLASRGLLDTLPRLLPEAPLAERAGLRKAALAQVQPEAQTRPF